MVAPLIPTAIHRSHRDLWRVNGSRSNLLLRQIHLLEPLDDCFAFGYALVANLTDGTPDAPQ
jgi:hypothetical protein